MSKQKQYGLKEKDSYFRNRPFGRDIYHEGHKSRELVFRAGRVAITRCAKCRTLLKIYFEDV